MSRYPKKTIIEIIDESAGSLMTDEYIRISPNLTVDEVLVELRQKVKGKANIHYLYVMDERNHLEGVLSLRELLGANGDLKISSIMKVKITTLNINTDQEYAAKVFQDTDLVTVPVVDDEHHMVGVVHVETMMDVMQQEATEDIHKMASIAIDDEEVEGGLLKAPSLWLYGKRMPWLVILVFVNLLSGAVISNYEELISQHAYLVVFLPLLIASGGNTGSQSTTLVIRAMAVGDVGKADWFKVVVKEIGVAFLLGVTMAIAIAGIGYYRGMSNEIEGVATALALTVAFSMIFVVLFGGILGAILPFLFRFFKFDPATASTPLVTSICDIAGVFIYFGIASTFLGNILGSEVVEGLALLLTY